MTYAITGIPLPDDIPQGEVPLRQDVNALFSAQDELSKKQVKLMLLAMHEFEQTDVTKMLSYFQIAGIHGLPDNQNWDGVPKNRSKRGYCTHGSILFPSFHRPYMLLFEQVLYNLMIDVVIPGNTTKLDQPKRDEWVRAAKHWRYPYWDWGLSPDVPAICKQKDVTVDMPDGPVQRKNPFFKFTMPKQALFKDHDVGDMKDQKGNVVVPFGQTSATSRCPTVAQGDDWVNGDVQNQRVPDSIKASFQSKLKEPKKPGEKDPEPVKDTVFRVLSNSYFKEYKYFATTFFYKKEGDKDPKHYFSLEGIHNMIHDGTGGSYDVKPVYTEGHMAEVPWAAFDPIFWLHHCNADRLYAIWQDLNPKLWWDPVDEGKPGHPVWVDPSTSLVPFHTNESGELYDSNKQREWFPMNYTYPELQRWKYMKNGEINWDAYNVDLKLTVERLYGKQEKHAFDVPKDVVVSPLHRRLIDEGKDLTLDDYVVNMRYKRFALDGVPYTIHVKLAGTEVGKVYTFTTRLPDEGEAGAEGTSSCVNCRAQKASGALSTGQELISSPLTRLVAKPGGPPRGQRADVIAWLEQPGNVEWNVTTYGQEVPLTDPSMADLRVSVARGTAIYYQKDEKLPDYEDYETLKQITNGRPGGLGNDEDW